MSNFLKWPKIQQVSGAVKDLCDSYAYKVFHKLEIPNPNISFRLKPKMHGTNAGVGLTADGKLVIQSRTRCVTPLKDNAGFAGWVEANREYFLEHLPKNGVLFGEWCGAGIQHGASICQIDRKVFAPFAWSPYGLEQDDTTEVIIVDPDDLSRIVGDHDDIYVLPWAGDAFTMDYTQATSRASFQENLERAVLDWEANDQWVEDTFGVKGIGEGFVGYPVTKSGKLSEKQLGRQLFKAKGTKHSKSKVKKVVSVDVEKIKTQHEFAEKFVTEARCLQGVEEGCDGHIDVRYTGKFIGWMCKDISEESIHEVAASDYTWKDLSAGVVQAARTWYLAKANEI